jgi:thymidine kinase
MTINGGDLQLILGTMFSGKTTYLLSEITKLSVLNYKILYVNIDFDTRSNIAFSTHNPFLHQTQPLADVLDMIKSPTLLDLNIDIYDVIIIDESHFFGDLVEFVHKCLLANKSIIVAGLIADSNGQKFGHTLDLIPICTDIIRLKAYCTECAKHRICRIATYSKRILPLPNNNTSVDIGGGEKYVPVCREHFFVDTSVSKNKPINREHYF